MLAKDIMDKQVVTLDPDTVLVEAVKQFIEKDAGCALVVKDNVVIGLITESDLLVSLDFLGEKNATHIPVKNFMTTDIVTISENTPIKEVQQVLVRKNIKCVPVMKEGKALGFIARIDILKHVMTTIT